VGAEQLETARISMVLSSIGVKRENEISGNEFDVMNTYPLHISWFLASEKTMGPSKCSFRYLEDITRFIIEVPLASS
jgi:hypothetical protein